MIARLIPLSPGFNVKHWPEWGYSDGLRLQIGVWIVIERPFRKPLPQQPQVFSHEVKIIPGKLGGLLFKIGKKLRVLIQSPANVSMIPEPSKPFRRNGPHDVHASRGQPSGRAEATGNRFPGERIPGEINNVIVKVTPGIIPGPDVHGLVVVQEMKWEGKHAVGALVIQVVRCGSAERREQ